MYKCMNLINQRSLSINLRFSLKNKKNQFEPSYNNRIQETKGSFNSLTSYAKLFRRQISYFGIMSIFLFNIYLFWKYSGVYENPFTKRKQWMIISPKRQQQIGRHCENILMKQFQSIGKVSIQNVNEKNTSPIPQKYQQSFTKLSKILKQLKKNYVVHVIRHQQPILIPLPNNTFFLSEMVLRQVDQQSLAILLQFSHNILLQRHHIAELSLKTALKVMFNDYTIDNDLIIRQLYYRKYSSLEIKYLIKLLTKTTGIEKQSQLDQERQIKQAFANISDKICRLKKYQDPSRCNKGNLCIRYNLVSINQ